MIIKVSEDKKEILKPADIYQILSDCLKSEDEVDRDKEHFWVFHLDCRNKIKLLELVSLGTLNSSIVHHEKCLPGQLVKDQLKLLSPTITHQE